MLHVAGLDFDVGLERAVAVPAQHGERHVRIVVGGQEIRLAVAGQVRDDDGVRILPRWILRQRLERAVAVAAQDAHRGRGVARDHEVRHAVPADVADRHVHRPEARGIVDARREGTVRLLHQNRDRRGSAVRDHEILSAVLVQISDRDVEDRRSRRVVDLGLEGAVPVPREYGSGARGDVRRGQVRIPVPVHVPDRDPVRVDHRIVGVPLERAVAVAQDHGNIRGVGGDRVQAAVVVQVSQLDRVWKVAHRKVHGRLEGPIAIPQHHGDVGAEIVRDDEVLLSVAVQVCGGDAEREFIGLERLPREEERAGGGGGTRKDEEEGDEKQSEMSHTSTLHWGCMGCHSF